MITLKDIIPEVNKMLSIKVEIDGKERGIDLGFVLDLEEEDSVLGKQNSASTYPDSQLDINKEHLDKKNHYGFGHTKDLCGSSFKWRTQEDYNEALTKSIYENEAQEWKS